MLHSVKGTGVLLWLQFAYAVWQFVRVAKFFRLPSALIYHTWLWMTKSEFRGGKPFSRQMIAPIVQGRKWMYPGSATDYLRDGDIPLNAGHFLQERHGVKYVVGHDDIANCNVLDRHDGFARQDHMNMFLCSQVDLIVPDLYIADVYQWAEGFDKFLMDGARTRDFKAKVLLMSSREHFLNQNFMRLLSILPLMLQAKNLDLLSLLASMVIIVLDQLSYPANLLWRAFVDLMVALGKAIISRTSQTKRRQFVSTFMATVSPRLAFSDQLLRNFYFVKKNETVLLFGTSCAEYFDIDSFQDVEEPAHDELNPFVELSEEDFYSLETIIKQNRNENFSEHYDIQIGSIYVEHRVGEGRIMTFFKPQHGAYYNFLDYDHLHFGNFEVDQEHKIRKALKWIQNNGRLPVACNHKGQLHAVAFNDFVDKVGMGYGVLRANVKKATWV